MKNPCAELPDRGLSPLRGLVQRRDGTIVCPKCRQDSGNDWSQCRGKCPLPMSPHYQPTNSAT